MLSKGSLQRQWLRLILIWRIINELCQRLYISPVRTLKSVLSIKNKPKPSTRILNQKYQFLTILFYSKTMIVQPNAQIKLIGQTAEVLSWSNKSPAWITLLAIFLMKPTTPESCNTWILNIGIHQYSFIANIIKMGTCNRWSILLELSARHW